MTISIFEHGSNEYEQMVQLRMQVLRIPLGLTFSEADLQKEKEDTLIGAFDNGKIMGCCILTKRDNHTIQLRQMAVASTQQRSGVGFSIIRFAEAWAKEQGYTTVMMHSRDVAIGFYQKLGYSIVGNPFTEIGILHYQMEKYL